MSAGNWTWLEFTKLLVDLLTPLVVAGLGVTITRATKRAERAETKAAERAQQAEWRNRRAIERLIQLHMEMAPLMNDIFCFFAVVGHFRDINPAELVSKKRQLDQLYFVNEQLFRTDFRTAYIEFLDACFEHWISPGEDAKIRMSAQWLRGERGANCEWEDEWDALFIREPGVDESMRLTGEQKVKYERAMRAFADQLGLGGDPENDPGDTRHRVDKGVQTIEFSEEHVANRTTGPGVR